MKNLNISKNRQNLFFSDTPRHCTNPMSEKFQKLNIAEVMANLPVLCSTPEHLRIAKDGTLVPANDFFNPTLRKIDFTKVYQYYENGFTIIVQGLNLYFNDLTESFFTTFGLGEKYTKIQMNAYITPSGENGFPIHWDLHDAFLIQVDGEKCWNLWKPIDSKPFFSADILGHQKLLEDLEQCTTPDNHISLKEKEFLFLPRGYLHKGIASTKGSMHITIGCRPSSIFDEMKERYKESTDIKFLMEFLCQHMNRNSYLGDSKYMENLNFLIQHFEECYAKS